MLTISAILQFLGRRVCWWLVITFVASCSLAITDYGLAIFLQAFLKLLGLTEANNNSSSWLLSWEPTIFQLLLLLAIIAILRGFTQFWVFQGAEFIHESINTRLRLFSLYEILKNPAQKFVSSTDTNVRIGEVYPKAAMFCWFASNVMGFLVQCLVLLAAMFYTAWREASLGIIGVGFISLIVLQLNRQVRRVSSRVPQEQKELVKGIERVARNWLLVRVMRTHNQEYNFLLNKSLSYYKHFVQAKFLGNLGATVPLVLGIFLLMVIIWANLSFWKTSPLKLVACIYLFGGFLTKFSRLGKGLGMMNSQFSYFKIAVLYVSKFNLDHVKETIENINQVNSLGKRRYFKQKLVNKSDNIKSIDTLQLSKPPQIKLDCVSFAYKPDSPYILYNISFQINPGEQLGITGKSGSGKSTLLGLILGILEPLDGGIYIAGIKPTEFLNQFPNSIGYVGAEPFLIEGTLKDNLDYGALRAYSDQEYNHALASASILDFVNNLPSKLDYCINENGEGLSAGQQQRLSLARALLRKPQILILDEASANLDEETEAKIALSIQQLKGLCTIIMVSHRPGILKFCDHTFDLSQLQQNQINS